MPCVLISAARMLLAEIPTGHVIPAGLLKCIHSLQAANLVPHGLRGRAVTLDPCCRTSHTLQIEHHRPTRGCAGPLLDSQVWRELLIEASDDHEEAYLLKLIKEVSEKSRIHVKVCGCAGGAS